MKKADADELKAGYRRMSIMYHPDKHVNSENKEVAERTFRLINEAYEGTPDAALYSFTDECR